MKKTIAILLSVVMLLGLCACGASAGGTTAPFDKNAAMDMAPAEPMPAPEASFDYGFTSNSTAADAPAPAPSQPSTAAPAPGGDGSSAPSSTLPENVKMIYRGYLELESTAFDAAMEGLNALVAQMGGYFETSELNNYDKNYRSAYYVVRVPSGKYQAFCASVGDLAQLNSQRHTTENVSEAYYDTEARLQTQRTKMERLQMLLEKAATMEDIISLETAIAETELQIEYLTGALRKYDALVDYATVQINLQEVYVLTEQEQPVIGFWPKLAQAFTTGTARFVDDVQDFALDFARHWVSRLIWLAILAVVIILAVRRRRKNKAEGKALPRLFRRKRKNAPVTPPQDTQENNAPLSGRRELP